VYARCFLLFFFCIYFHLLCLLLYTVIVLISETISPVRFPDLIFNLSWTRPQFKGVAAWLETFLLSLRFRLHCAEAEVFAEIFLTLVETEVIIFF
jgi:hypothetical protein